MINYKYFLILLFLFISVKSKSQEKNLSSTLLFDNDWKFKLGDDSLAKNKDYNDSAWRILNLPHDYSIEHDFDKENKTSGGGGFAYSGIAWYRKTFDVSNFNNQNKYYILFEGIYKNSEVWVNGQYLGKRPYGYSSFYYEISKYLNDKENIIAVKVDTKDQPNSRYYTGAGIYRHVYFITKDELRFKQWGVFAKTNIANKQFAEIEISSDIINSSIDLKKAKISVSIADSNNNIVYKKNSKQFISANDTVQNKLAIKIKDPKLWSVHNPYLYNLNVSIINKGKIVDNYNTKYGIRTFKFDPNNGFSLNGEHLKLKGVNLHHDGGPLGAANFDYTYERQLKLLKSVGCNAIRLSHNPHAPAFLDAADKLGFLLIDEIFDEWEIAKMPFGYALNFKDWYKRDVENWIMRDRNHPSVIAWSIGNEVLEQRDSLKGPEITKKLLTEAKKYDTTRPFTIGGDGIAWINKNEMKDLLDIFGYNYLESTYKKDHANFPNRVIFGSETANNPYHAGTCVQAHTYQEWLSTYNEKYIAGEFLWTGFDYLGEAGIGGATSLCEKDLHWPWWPIKSATCGLFDLCGFEKPAYYFRKSIWTSEPVLYVAVETDKSAKNWEDNFFWGWPKVQAHWNHKNVGDTLAVHVYTNIKDIELKINDTSYGKQQYDFQKQAYLIYNVPFIPGKIEAIGTLPNGTKKVFTINTAGKAFKIKLSADKTKLGSNEVCYVKAEVFDEKNNPIPFETNLLKFKIEGNGEIIAVGNGSEEGSENYKNHQRITHQGKALAIIKSNGKGKLKLTVESNGLISDSTEFEIP